MTYPVHEHFLFKEKREHFAHTFHALAEEMRKKEIDVSFLHEVIDASQAVGDIQADTAYRLGYERGFQTGRANRKYEIFQEEFWKKAAE
ncbi:hypothetical protein [Salibacterium halotolerans]|uniref:Uncharacterized protein n=1 Tax=Salibacterium halotolerans TaxID=1884432 RepID=A0A1I5LE91_9BACI|nr:hypothetical protein [Salibacterium halotolerans]SFO95493.1 hypothetical protein SAMN05518683_101208 [Salibacterium halotolerans]